MNVMRTFFPEERLQFDKHLFRMGLSYQSYGGRMKFLFKG